MNYNANNAARPGPGRKIKRVSDINAMGAPATAAATATGAPFMTPQYNQPTSQSFGGNPLTPGLDTAYMPPTTVPQYGAGPAQPYMGTGYAGEQMHQQQQQQQQTQSMPQMGGQFTMFQQPIVQDMAMQYGQKLADQGKQLVESHFEKYVPVTRLKYYFAVDNKYVINKLRLLLFPFTHSDWSLKYDQDNPVQPRYDINAPDLYIPTMAYITYVVLAGLVLGMQNRFSPEQLGILASSALAYSIFELIVYSITLYVANIPSTLKTLDLLAYSGYKFVIIVICILVSIIFQRIGYYGALLYCSITLGVFLLRTLKVKVQHEPPPSTDPSNLTYDVYGQPQPSQVSYNVGKKRKLYFLFLVAGFQPVLSFWLSMHLIPTAVRAAAAGSATGTL